MAFPQPGDFHRICVLTLSRFFATEEYGKQLLLHVPFLLLRPGFEPRTCANRGRQCQGINTITPPNLSVLSNVL